MHYLEVYSSMRLSRDHIASHIDAFIARFLSRTKGMAILLPYSTLETRSLMMCVTAVMSQSVHNVNSSKFMLLALSTVRLIVFSNSRTVQINGLEPCMLSGTISMSVLLLNATLDAISRVIGICTVMYDVDAAKLVPLVMHLASRNYMKIQAS